MLTNYIVNIPFSIYLQNIVNMFYNREDKNNEIKQR